MIKPGGARDLTPYGATFKQWGREPVYKHAPLQFLTWTNSEVCSSQQLAVSCSIKPQWPRAGDRLRN